MIKVISFPEREGIYDEVKITLNGQRVLPAVCRVSAMPFNSWWVGQQRNINQTELAGIISIIANEPVEFTVNTESLRGTPIIRPLHSAVKLTTENGITKFTLKKPGNYVLELPNEHCCIHIFINEPKDFSCYGTPTHYFGAGVHEVGKLTLKSGDRVFIDEGAYVKGVLFAQSVSNVKIYGYGRLDGGFEERKNGRCYEDDTNGCIKFYDSSDIQIEGITLSDSAVWVLSFFHCQNVTVDNIKIVGQWRYNTDGIDVVNSSNIRIKNSFIRAFDDAITLKGIAYYADSSLENIIVEGCVLWCGWGRTLEIGLETVANRYENIRFIDCDLIHNSAVALDIQSGDYAEICNILYRDIRVEYTKDTTIEIIEQPLGVPYLGKGKLHVPTLIKICTQPYDLDGEEFTEYIHLHEKIRKDKSSSIHDICFDGITVYLQSGVPFPDIIMDVRLPATLGKVEIKNVRVKRYK